MNVRSENLRLRLPKAMHDQLREMAENQGITMNTLVVLLLADAMEFTFRTPDSAADDEPQDGPHSAPESPGLGAAGDKDR
jgi:hypothetical protein